MDRLLQVPAPVAGRRAVSVVLPAGEHPRIALRVPRPPKVLLGGQRFTRRSLANTLRRYRKLVGGRTSPVKLGQ
jgi:hypothetical protein